MDYLPTRAEERIRACGGFNDKKKFVPYSKNLKFELGMVTYNGTGKYRQTDVVAPWNAIPEDERGFPSTRAAEYHPAFRFGANRIVVARCLRP